MNHIQITREHHQSFSVMKKIARSWLIEAEQTWQLECDCEASENQEIIHFKRSGVSGVLVVNESELRLEATLGFLLKPYKSRIEKTINANLDQLFEQLNSESS